MKDKNTLVSISVITYNSSKYVLDTLESIKAQTYSPLELVISDDCSTDNTVEVCREWIVENKDRFLDAKVVVAPKNRGISANYNQGMDNCTGEYIKEIAGDDMLLPNCIEDYISYVTKYPEAYFCFGRVRCLSDNKKRIEMWADEFKYDIFDMPVEQQWRTLTVRGNCISSATFFYNRARMMKLGIRNDERIPFMEDWAKWINITAKGEKLWLVNKETAIYRMGDNALSTQTLPSPRFQLAMAQLYLLYLFTPQWKFGNKRKAIRRYAYAKATVTRKWYWNAYVYLHDGIAKIIQKWHD